MRIDQWLWAVRLYRTRKLAATAVRAGHVRMGGETTKPARILRPGEEITALTGRITRTYRVLGYPPSRVGAALVPEYALDLTPAPSAGSEGAGAKGAPIPRSRGAGRPTKRERRVLDRLLGDED